MNNYTEPESVDKLERRQAIINGFKTMYIILRMAYRRGLLPCAWVVWRF